MMVPIGLVFMQRFRVLANLREPNGKKWHKIMTCITKYRYIRSLIGESDQATNEAK